MGKINYNEVMQELATYKRIQEETNAIIESLQDTLKQAMLAAGTDVIIGHEHKATYKEITSTRFDGTAFKKDNPALYASYQKESTSRRFTFN